MTTGETCTECGGLLLRNAAFCGSCGEPTDWRARMSLNGQELRVASLGKRVLAFGIDLAVVYGVYTALRVLGVIAGLGLGTESGQFEEYRLCIRQATTPEARSDCASELFPNLWALIVLGFLVPFAVAMTYWTVCNIRGVSLGKYAAGIRVVNARGGRPGFGRGLVRTFAAFFLSTPLFWLGYWWAFWQRRRRTWHDMIAGTYVVRVPAASRPLEADSSGSQASRAL